MTGSSGASWGVLAEGTPSLPPPNPHNTHRRKRGKALCTPQARQLYFMEEEGVWCVPDPLPKFSTFPRGEELCPKYLLVYPRAQFRGPESMPWKSGEYTHSQGHTHRCTHTHRHILLHGHTYSDTQNTHSQTHTLTWTHILTDTHPHMHTPHTHRHTQSK